MNKGLRGRLPQIDRLEPGSDTSVKVERGERRSNEADKPAGRLFSDVLRVGEMELRQARLARPSTEKKVNNKNNIQRRGKVKQF